MNVDFNDTAGSIFLFATVEGRPFYHCRCKPGTQYHLCVRLSHLGRTAHRGEGDVPIPENGPSVSRLHVEFAHEEATKEYLHNAASQPGQCMVVAFCPLEQRLKAKEVDRSVSRQPGSWQWCLITWLSLCNTTSETKQSGNDRRN